MKVRMSYDIEAEKIPAELKKNKREISEMLLDLSETFAKIEIVNDTKRINLCRIAIEKCYEDLQTASDKTSSLLNYLSSYSDVVKSLDEEAVRQKAEQLIEERSAKLKEEMEAVINDTTEEFNKLIKQREDKIKELESKNKELEAASKKKPTRKKKNA